MGRRAQSAALVGRGLPVQSESTRPSPLGVVLACVVARRPTIPRVRAGDGRVVDGLLERPPRAARDDGAGAAAGSSSNANSSVGLVLDDALLRGLFFRLRRLRAPEPATAASFTAELAKARRRALRAAPARTRIARRRTRPGARARSDGLLGLGESASTWPPRALPLRLGGRAALGLGFLSRAPFRALRFGPADSSTGGGLLRWRLCGQPVSPSWGARRLLGRFGADSNSSSLSSSREKSSSEDSSSEFQALFFLAGGFLAGALRGRRFLRPASAPASAARARTPPRRTPPSAPAAAPRRSPDHREVERSSSLGAASSSSESNW